MLVSRKVSMEKHESVQEESSQRPVFFNKSIFVQSDCSNTVVKQEMAEALLSQGLSEEAVCRLLHFEPDQLPDKP